ncbi:hypothetical protein B2G71_20935 [Novosphingobium sp. PC22D]|uniref:hypothetical protein n=1 Tax=Novosphingobium sp. PC22D TaxID=1962403 RepID=UPI000BF0F3DD|nr:hypothetical protein [Novosphingobium sp. PC22D]PEQ10657.1 hypothetical protein B2G71_20935 [Novosphingobium sp. PC22D]
MSQPHPYRENDPTGEEESDDLKAIRRDMEIDRLLREMSQRLDPDGGRFRRELEQVAEAAQNWGAATFKQRFRALRVVVSRLGREEARLLALMAAPKSKQSWILSVRHRKDSEKSDGGKRDREREREDLAQRVGEEVYQRMAAGQPKDDAIAAVKEDYRTGVPYPQIGDFPAINRPRLNLPDVEGVKKLLSIFRRNARKRGYVNPNAPYRGSSVVREPDLKVSDIPKRGRPRKK